MRPKYYLIGVLLSMSLLSELSCTSFSEEANNKNFKIAYVDKVDDSLVITVMGRRTLMVHDPISALKNKTYVDSAKFMIPKNKSFSGKNEVHAVGAGYPIVSGGIWLKNDTIRVDLQFNDYDHHQIYSTGWNGTYVIFRR